MACLQERQRLKGYARPSTPGTQVCKSTTGKGSLTRKAGAGDMDLEGGHIEATADTVRADDLSEGESETKELRPIWGKHSQFNIKYQN